MNDSTHHPYSPEDSATVGTLFEQRLDAAIQQKPSPGIPKDFAARVALRAATLPLRRRRTLPVGRTIGWISTALLALALFALAPHATPSLTNFGFDAEIFVLLELCGLSWLLSRDLGKELSR